MKITRSYTIDVKIVMEFEKLFEYGGRSKKLEELMIKAIDHKSTNLNLGLLEKQKLEVEKELRDRELTLKLIQTDLDRGIEEEKIKSNSILKEDHNRKVFIEQLDQRCIYCKGIIDNAVKSSTQFSLEDRDYKSHKSCGLSNMHRVKNVKEQYVLMLKQIRDNTFEFPNAEVEE